MDPAEILKIGEDIGNYRYFPSMKGGKAGADSLPHLKELYFGAMVSTQEGTSAISNMKI